jgi:hypothetical protein
MNYLGSKYMKRVLISILALSLSSMVSAARPDRYVPLLPDNVTRDVKCIATINARRVDDGECRAVTDGPTGTSFYFNHNGCVITVSGRPGKPMLDLDSYKDACRYNGQPENSSFEVPAYAPEPAVVSGRCMTSRHMRVCL